MRLLYLLIALLPSRIKILVYNTFLGCEIDKTARIGFSYVGARKIKMGPHARIGHLNVVKHLELFELGENSKVERRNRFTALPLSTTKHFTEEKDHLPTFITKQKTNINQQNSFNCNGTIQINNFSTVATVASRPESALHFIPTLW